MRVAIIGNYPQSTHIAGGVQAAAAYLVSELRLIDGLELHIVTVSYAMSKQPLCPRGGTLKHENASIGKATAWSSTRRASDRRRQNGHRWALVPRTCVGMTSSSDGSGVSEQDEPDQVASINMHLLPGLPRFEFIQNYRTYQTHMNETLARIQPDVVHAQDAAQDAYVALRSGYPTVITVHGIRYEDAKYIGHLVKRLRNRVHSMLIERQNVRRTRHLIAISRYVTEYFATSLRPETRVYHIPNAVHRRFFELEDAGNGRTVFFAGRIIRRKQPLDLIRAFARVAQNQSDTQLRLAGEYRSDAKYAESVRAFIYQAGLDEQVHLLGPLPEDELLREFARCDVLALPSIQETAPMVIAQAMAAGKPVVATSVGGVAEMVDDGRTGFLCKAGDIEGMAEALQRLLQERSLRSELGQIGRRKAKENYYAPNIAHKTYEVYRTIAGGT